MSRRICDRLNQFYIRFQISALMKFFNVGLSRLRLQFQLFLVIQFVERGGFKIQRTDFLDIHNIYAFYIYIYICPSSAICNEDLYRFGMLNCCFGNADLSLYPNMILNCSNKINQEYEKGQIKQACLILRVKQGVSINIIHIHLPHSFINTNNVC